MSGKCEEEVAMSSAKDQMTKMLDQLMGQNRDGEFKCLRVWWGSLY